MKTVKWGIIGSGNIAAKFAENIKLVKNATLIDCSSKDEEKAKNFKNKFNLENSYGSYEQMLNNPKIDAVYIATTHNFHYDNMIQCLENGKHILCEKAFTINANQAKEVFALAKEKRLFVMEGMWTRFLPVTRWVKEEIQKGSLGNILNVSGQFGIKFPYNPQSRAFNKNLAGGGLLDLGIYPLSFVCNMLGNNPVTIGSAAKIGKTGVDEQATISLGYENGQIATITYSMLANYENTAYINGTKGSIEIDHTAVPTRATLTNLSGETQGFINDNTNGFEYEIKEATDLILQGKFQSLTISWEDTISIMEICDKLRAQWGFVYPEENL